MITRATASLIWTFWLLTMIMIVGGSFAFLEWLLWDTLTLSRFVWDATLDHPLLVIGAVYLLGEVHGGLAVHFWWHWAPPGSASKG